ncbi:pyruvate kinase [Tissierella pigra]|nr:pyruvate kinase [Tissierella pigra]
MAIASKYRFIKPTSEDIKDKCFKIIHKFKPASIVLSYIENKEDVIDFRKSIQCQIYNPTIMSKIECYSAVQNVDDIIDVSDEIMLARGCLATNIGLENLLCAQDLTLEKCIEKNKRCWIASNILKSLSSYNAPTCADICDLSHMIKQ